MMSLITGRNNVFPYFVNSTETWSRQNPSRFHRAETLWSSFPWTDAFPLCFRVGNEGSCFRHISVITSPFFLVSVTLCREHISWLYYHETMKHNCINVHVWLIYHYCKEVFPPPDRLGNILCPILLKSTLFCFSSNSQITLVCDFGAESFLKASKFMELNF